MHSIYVSCTTSKLVVGWAFKSVRVNGTVVQLQFAFEYSGYLQAFCYIETDLHCVPINRLHV